MSPAEPPAVDLWPALYARYRERAAEYAAFLLSPFPVRVVRPEPCTLVTPDPAVAAFFWKEEVCCAACLRRHLAAGYLDPGMEGIAATARALALVGHDPEEAARVLVLATAFAVDAARHSGGPRKRRALPSGARPSWEVRGLVCRPDGRDDHWHHAARRTFPRGADLWRDEGSRHALLSVVSATDVVDLAVLQGALLRAYDLCAVLLEGETTLGPDAALPTDCGRVPRSRPGVRVLPFRRPPAPPPAR